MQHIHGSVENGPILGLLVHDVTSSVAFVCPGYPKDECATYSSSMPSLVSRKTLSLAILCHAFCNNGTLLSQLRNTERSVNPGPTYIFRLSRSGVNWQRVKSRSGMSLTLPVKLCILVSLSFLSFFVNLPFFPGVIYNLVNLLAYSLATILVQPMCYSYAP